MSSDSDLYPKRMPWVKQAGTAAFLAALLLPMLAACGQKSTPDQNTGGVATLRVFLRDTQQASLDLGSQGTGPGDQFIYSGDLFDHAGGRKVGAHRRPVHHVQWEHYRCWRCLLHRHLHA